MNTGQKQRGRSARWAVGGGRGKATANHSPLYDRSPDNPFSSLPGKMKSEVVCQRELGLATVLKELQGAGNSPYAFLTLVPTQER